MFLFRKPSMPDTKTALPGRDTPVFAGGTHDVNGRPITGPYPEGTEIADFAMGCFWGAEKVFWSVPGVWVTAVGYQGGITPNPTYREACTGQTGHAEAVRVEYDPQVVGYEKLLLIFFANHDPTQVNRQGPDFGKQYRTGVFYRSEEQRAEAQAVKEALQKSGRFARPIATEITPAAEFWMAEDYHQQYLAKRGLSHCSTP